VTLTFPPVFSPTSFAQVVAIVCTTDPGGVWMENLSSVTLPVSAEKTFTDARSNNPTANMVTNKLTLILLFIFLLLS
jgi:hypothetical protein